MRARSWPAVLTLAALLAAPAAQADPVGRYVYLSPFAGYTLFDGDFRFPQAVPLKDNPQFGVRLGYQRGSLLAFELAGGVVPTTDDIPDGANSSFAHLTGNIVVSPWAGRMGGPFVFVGMGGGRFDATVPSIASNGRTTMDQGLLDFGAGIRLWLTDAVGLRLEARNSRWLPKDAPGNPDASHITLGGGLVLALGAKARDTDDDGVPDSRDVCADTPKGARVDAKGCPIDSDSDAVFDGLDQCEGTPKGCKVDAKGCPVDSDGDGVCDGLDQCADTPRGAKVDPTGCPLDSDGDAVFDGLDQCEGTPKGCKVDERGCPVDSDGDGVCDGLDQCADTPKGLEVDVNGCPIEVIEKETELLDTGKIRLQDVNFETGKADLLPGADSTLDVVGIVLQRWPQLRIEIGGHTDARGSAAANRTLSEARAQAVLEYLAKKFPDLKPEQFSVQGYGEDRPIAPNTTPEGMAKNRRVEFVVLNKDVLKKEIEHRRLLKEGETVPDSLRAPVQPDTSSRQ